MIMELSVLAEKLDLRTAVLFDGTSKVTGCYTGDLLSDCLVHSKPGDALVTVLLHENTLAVAKKNMLSCVIAANTSFVPEKLVKIALTHGVNLLFSERDSYHISVGIYRLLKG